MTTQDLVARAVPVARAAVPFPVRPFVPFLVRLFVEIAVGLLAPGLLPLITALLALTDFLSPDFLAKLRNVHSVLSTPREQFCPQARKALASAEALAAMGLKRAPELEPTP